MNIERHILCDTDDDLALPRDADSSRPSSNSLLNSFSFCPSFSGGLKENTELLVGSTARLELVVRGWPKPAICLFKDDEPLTEDERIQVRFQSNEIFELIIEKVSEADSGRYEVRAMNSAGKAYTNGSIIVTKDKISFHGSDDSDSGDSSIFRSSPNYHLRPDTPNSGRSGRRSRSKTPLSDIFKGSDYEASEHFACGWLDEEEDTVAIVFQRVTPKNEGVYTCVANTTSSKGIFNCSAELTVKGRDRDREAPVCRLLDIEHVVVNEGQSAMLETKFSGWPRPEVRWFKADGTEVVADGRCKSLYDDDDESFVLMIKTTIPSDTGMYLIKAENELGEAAGSAKLSVCSKPKIAVHMGNVSVFTEETVRLEIQVDEVYPQPDVFWTKNGVPLESGQFGRVRCLKEDVKCVLSIDHSRLDDSGSYCCVMKNSVGEDSSSATVTVAAPPKWAPHFTRRLTDYESRDGDREIDFTARIDAKPEATVRWLYENKEVRANELFRFEVGQGEDNGLHVLWIAEVSAESSGLYACEATNDEGSATSTGRLTVNAKPRFVERLEDIGAVAPNSDISLKIKVTGQPPPEIAWFKNGMPLESGSRVSISDSKLRLSISGINEDDCGEYSVQASNIFGSVTSQSRVEVFGKPLISSGLVNLELSEGDENVTLQVNVKPQPIGVVCRARWFVDGVEVSPLDSNSSYSVVRSKDGSDPNCHKLVIQRADERTQGLFKCLVSNPYGECVSSAKVVVNSKPNIVTGLKDRLIPRDEEVVLKVICTGSPEPNCRWLKDGRELIGDGNRIKLEASQFTYMLIISSGIESDSGLYTCEPFNCFGRTTTSAAVRVVGVCQFVKKLQDVEGSAGDQISLEIELEESPLMPKINWFLNEQEISEYDSKYKMCEPSSHGRRLLIRRAEDSNSGLYRCVVSNKFGSIECSAQVTVRSSPKFLKSLSDMRLPLNRSLVLAIDGYSGNPTPELKWFKGDKLINEDDRIRVQFDSTIRAGKLTIESVNAEDAGEYSCTIENALGSERTSATVDVTSKPLFKRSLVDKVETVHGALGVEFLLEIEDQPLPVQVTWFVDDIEIVEADERFTLIDDGRGNRRLIVKRADEGTAGQYRCIVKNEFGQIESSSVLSVTSKPKFVQGLETRELLEKSSASTEWIIVLTGCPTPEVVFTRNGKLISAADEKDGVKIEKESDLVYVLKVDSASADAAGLYEVVASNRAGSASSKAVLSVLSKPVIVKCTPWVFATISEASAIEATITGNPQPKVRWLRDGAEMLASRCERSVGNGNIHRVNFAKVSIDDDADFVVEATNSVGSATSRKIHFIVISAEERLAMAAELAACSQGSRSGALFEPASASALELGDSKESKVRVEREKSREPIVEPLITKKFVPVTGQKQEAAVFTQITRLTSTAAQAVVTATSSAATSLARTTIVTCEHTAATIVAHVRQTARIIAAYLRLPDDPTSRKVVQVILVVIIVVVINYLSRCLPPTFKTPKTEEKVVEQVHEFLFKCSSESCKK